MSKLVDLSTIIDNLDIKQLNDVLCRDNIELSYLEDMKKFKFPGVVYMIDDKIAGILIHTDICLYPFLVILVICSDPFNQKYKIGTFLMDYIKKYAKSKNIPYIIAHITNGTDNYYKKMN